MVSVSRGIYLVLLYCSQTLPQAVWLKTLVCWTPPECSTPSRDTLLEEQRRGFQPSAGPRLGSRTDHSFIPGLSSSRAGSRAPLLIYYLKQETESLVSLTVLGLLSLLHITISSKCSGLFPKSPFMGISNISCLLLLPLTRRRGSYTWWGTRGWSMLANILPHAAGFLVSSRHWKTLLRFPMPRLAFSSLCPMQFSKGQTPTGSKICLFL